MDYIPDDDADALIWFQSFRDNIDASESSYFLTSVDSAAITNAVALFTSAMAVASNENSRTKGAIDAKDLARAQCESLCRVYAMQIKANPGISDELKIDAGVRPPNSERNPVPPPTTSPALTIKAVTPGSLTVEYRDSLNPDTKAKPFGTESLQLFVGVAAAGEVIMDPSQCQFYGAYTKNPIGIAFAPSENGKQATLYARWAGRNGMAGPFSLPSTMAIAA